MHKYDQTALQRKLAENVPELHLLVTTVLDGIHKAKQTKEMNEIDPTAERLKIAQSKLALAVNRILVCFLNFAEPNFS